MPHPWRLHGWAGMPLGSGDFADVKLCLSGLVDQNRRASLWALSGMRGGPPWQILPQPARREDDREQSGHAEREERPDKEEGSVGLGDRSADSRPLHVDDGDDQLKERSEQDDDVSR